MTRVVVLGGGPDAERAVSLNSSAEVAEALRASGEFEVAYTVIDRATLDDLRAARADVVFPVLHGRWGEGGPLQDLLESLGTPYVGCAPRAARLAMDKVASRTFAQFAGLDCKPCAILDPNDPVRPLDLPLVVKPVFEGSSVGLFVCRTEDEWRRAHRASADSGKVTLIEPYIKGREITLAMIQDGPGDASAPLRALPFIEIQPAEGLYDYEAKYTRDDTRYTVGPALPAGLEAHLVPRARAFARAMGLRHLCRVDFILDDDGRAWFLEVNTMPGFTTHSLVPMSARTAGLPMPALCAHLVRCALAR